MGGVKRSMSVMPRTKLAGVSAMAAPHHLPKEEDFNTHFIEEETEAQGGLVLWVPFGSPSGCLFVALHARPPPTSLPWSMNGTSASPRAHPGCLLLSPPSCVSSRPADSLMPPGVPPLHPAALAQAATLPHSMLPLETSPTLWATPSSPN